MAALNCALDRQSSFSERSSTVAVGAAVDFSLIDKWIPKKSQVAMVELFATVVALRTFREKLAGSCSLLPVDSEPVQGALAKGYSAREDLCELVGAFWNIALELRVQLYINRVPTDANPADHPSRDRMQVGTSLGSKTLAPIFPDL